MRTAEQVVEDHLEKRAMGDLEGDIRQNYAKDIVLLTTTGVYRGHDGVREAAEELNEYLSDGVYEFTTKYVEGSHAFVEWNTDGIDTQVSGGADSFMVENGKITFQSIHYMVSEE